MHQSNRTRSVMGNYWKWKFVIKSKIRHGTNVCGYKNKQKKNNYFLTTLLRCPIKVQGREME